ncbi:MAG: hypothetical protein IJ088_12900 [Clostridia bacterium]|nr:hypothetical protein [Clostridia bacterium]
MKITTFNPQIVTNNPEPVIELFEALGFEKRHTKEGIGIGEMKANDCRLKDVNGFHVDISRASLPLPRDGVVIRMNVDDFDEAYKILESHGFKNDFGDVGETGSSKSAVMGSPSGFKIVLIQHIK